AHPEYKIHFEIFNLPEDERNLVVNANEALIKTALVNLMENGCKFSPDYKIKVLMDCQLNQQIQIDIEDNGPGINEADLPYIFEPFYRSPQTSVIKGSGIGLSLVSSILKIHKIRMDVFPGVSGGTVFRLMFTPIAIQQTELTSKPIALQSKTQFELQYH
ncbi:MAG: sensor histidine kinase, partial [Saprospiraceae bacterium]